MKRLKKKIKELTRRNSGRSLRRVVAELMNYLRGWWNYFSLAESRNRIRDLAGWIHRRLRALIWKQWKNCRTRTRELLKRGIPVDVSKKLGSTRKGPWRISKVRWLHQALPGRTFVAVGLTIPWESHA